MELGHASVICIALYTQRRIEAGFKTHITPSFTRVTHNTVELTTLPLLPR